LETKTSSTGTVSSIFKSADGAETVNGPSNGPSISTYYFNAGTGEQRLEKPQEAATFFL
jgi:hypothetical protein